MTSPDGRCVLVRHGETAWSRSGKHTGLTDVSLTAEGTNQARRLAPTLAAFEFSQVRVSPLGRATHTAELAELEPVVVDADLVEWDYGEYEGKTSEEIHRTKPGWTVFSESTPGAETIGQVEHRADRVLERVSADLARGHDVALVAHGHLLRVLAARWLGRPGTFGAQLLLDAASISVLDHEHDIPALRSWNWTPESPI